MTTPIQGKKIFTNEPGRLVVQKTRADYLQGSSSSLTSSRSDQSGFSFLFEKISSFFTAIGQLLAKIFCFCWSSPSSATSSATSVSSASTTNSASTTTSTSPGAATPSSNPSAATQTAPAAPSIQSKLLEQAVTWIHKHFDPVSFDRVNSSNHYLVILSLHENKFTYSGTLPRYVFEHTESENRSVGSGFQEEVLLRNLVDLESDKNLQVRVIEVEDSAGAFRLYKQTYARNLDGRINAGVAAEYEIGSTKELLERSDLAYLFTTKELPLLCSRLSPRSSIQTTKNPQTTQVQTATSSPASISVSPMGKQQDAPPTLEETLIQSAAKWLKNHSPDIMYKIDKTQNHVVYLSLYEGQKVVANYYFQYDEYLTTAAYDLNAYEGYGDEGNFETVKLQKLLSNLAILESDKLKVRITQSVLVKEKSPKVHTNDVYSYVQEFSCANRFSTTKGPVQEARMTSSQVNQALRNDGFTEKQIKRF